MERVEPRSDAGGDVEGRLDPERAVVLDRLQERAAANVGDGQVLAAVDLADLEDRDEVLVLDLLRRTPLVNEALPEGLVLDEGPSSAPSARPACRRARGRRGTRCPMPPSPRISSRR